MELAITRCGGGHCKTPGVQGLEKFHGGLVPATATSLIKTQKNAVHCSDLIGKSGIWIPQDGIIQMELLGSGAAYYKIPAVGKKEQ